MGEVTLGVPEEPPSYRALWSFDRADEKRAIEGLIAGFMERRTQYPDMHLYHYAPYEPTAIKQLAGAMELAWTRLTSYSGPGRSLIFTGS